MRERPEPSSTMAPQSLETPSVTTLRQGMTLPNMHLDPSGIFAPGQLYVGLSRAPSLAGLTLAERVTPGHVLHDQRVRRYQAELFGLPVDEPEDEPVIA